MTVVITSRANRYLIAAMAISPEVAMRGGPSFETSDSICVESVNGVES